MNIKFNLIKEHADLLNRPLSQDKRLNMMADHQPDITRSDARGPMAAHPACAHWDIKTATLFLRGGKLASQYNEQLKTQLQDKSLTTFIKEKESWTQQKFDTVDWSACGTAFKRLSKNRQVSKTCFNYWHMGARHATFYQEDYPCCFCNNEKEDWKHILTCESLDANLNRSTSWVKLKKSMEVWHLPNDFWISMEKGVVHTTTHAGTTNTVPLPFAISTDPGRMQLRGAFKERSKIGWLNVLKGRLSTRWQDFVTAHLKAIKSRFKADEWAANFVAALWEHTLRIWQNRNDAFHVDNEAQTKRYKLEALGRNKSQLRARGASLQDILHDYQTIHFAHPERIEDLRYDSPCCWATFATLYLDKVENRLPAAPEYTQRYRFSQVGIG
jgi:hypothetical protein